MLVKQSNSQSAVGFLIPLDEVNIVPLLGFAISYLGIKKVSYFNFDFQNCFIIDCCLPNIFRVCLDIVSHRNVNTIFSINLHGLVSVSYVMYAI